MKGKMNESKEEKAEAAGLAIITFEKRKGEKVACKLWQGSKTS